MREGRRRGTATVLFTDLVGSTELLVDLGEAGFGDLRRGHLATLGKALGDHGGEEIKTLGDGILAVFGSAADALSCAVAMQRSVDREAREGAAPLAVRMGLAVGDVCFEDGDVFGRAVVEASRLVSAARGGQILATAVVPVVAGGWSASSLTDLGPLELKGFPEPVRVAEVAWEPLAPGGQPAFVGRGRALARLGAALDRTLTGWSQLVLVSGEAGIGKTSLLVRLAEEAARQGAVTAWGTCWDSGRAPGFWPWTQAIRSVLHELPGELVAELAAHERAQLAQLVPELGFGREPPGAGSAEQARFQLLAAAASFLELAARHRPLVVMLDDLQWADASSLDLLEFVSRPGRRPVALLVAGAYRQEEVEPGSAAAMFARLAGTGEAIHLGGLEEAEVGELVRLTVGDETAERWAAEIHQRSGGHPFFARELAHLLAAHPAPDSGVVVPAAVREVIERRVARLSPACARMLEAAAVAGNQVLPDVLADVGGIDVGEVVDLLGEAIQAGVLVAGDSPVGHPRFTHDLFRETLFDGLPARRRTVLHQQVGAALERRHGRGGDAFPGEMTRHFTAAIGIDGPERAVRWAVAAAEVDRDALSFADAAAHLERVRQAAQDQGIALPETVLVDLLVMEADARARSGDPASARRLLDRSLQLARALTDPPRLAAVALGVQRLGARAGMPRDEIVALLDEARAGLVGAGSALEAEVTASLACELCHSGVPEQRPRARPLSAHALDIARAAADTATLASCLLARHDVLWGPGTAEERLALATEITDLAERGGDPERRSQGVLLRANALLALGSPAFRAELERYLQLAAELRQPRHDYFVLTRRAALAVLDGRIDEGERLMREASALGVGIGEPDTENVEMTQMCQVALVRGEPDRLLATAERAVSSWVGVPALSHAVAAGFRALAGDLDGARRALAVVVELGTWRDRSFLWSAIVGPLTAAAARLGARNLVADLYEELRPMAAECGVHGAVLSFMGSNAHWAGVAASALGRREDAVAHLEHALATHERLGAAAWEAHTCAELAEVLGEAGEHHRARAAAIGTRLGLHGVLTRVGRPAALAPTEGPSVPAALLRRDGELWEVGLSGRTGRVRDAKGLHDLAVLVRRPGVEVHVLDLASPRSPRPGWGAGPVLDARARGEYRRRLGELEDERADAARDRDEGRLALLDAERECLLAQLRGAVGFGGRARTLGGDATERARKSVTARVRDAIRRIEAVVPELGSHLDRSVRTGTCCRYQPVEPVSWSVSDE